MKLNLKTLLVVVLFTCSITGCATLTKPPMAEVRLNSYPQNVQVLLNGYDQGVTPLTVNVDRKKNHNITFMIRGHQPIHVQIRPKLDVATTIFGNLVSWNVVGVVVDLVTGHAYTLTPADIEQNFETIAKSVHTKSTQDEIHLFVLTKSEWDQIKTTQTPLVAN